MANLTNAYEKILLDALTGVTPWTSPTTVYISLHTADPTESGLVTDELSGDGYSRISLNNVFPSATSESNVNILAIASANADADWPTITHVGYCASSTVGADDMILYDSLSLPVNVLTGNAFAIAIGNALITVA